MKSEDKIQTLFLAVSRNNLKDIEQLIDGGVDINSQEARFKRTALHIACVNGLTKLADLLIKKGANLNLLDYNRMTPLMCACSTGKKKGSQIALQLMRSGADVSYVRDDDMAAINFAVWGNCSQEVFELLISKGAKPPGADFVNVQTY
ncbi:ankyrin repeat domain-containing protein [Microbulbifer pacificus]|uniref:ankyrin repeat domain-containing protein n=1 Tax=Microbulbifer pacificus TaxID=407164 RepID=UPI000CF3ABF6|nr:ankyrin repeat domain-containing protein [Microbulbifer pacificus]